jgi:hypothetical protein
MGSSGVKRFGPPSAERDLPTIIVDETFVRRRVERLIELVEKESHARSDLFKSIASHPLLTLTIAFIPLIIFGVTFSNDSRVRHTRELFEQQSFYQNNINSLSKALISRNERGVLLRSALVGNLGTCEGGGLSDNYKVICKKQMQELIYERKKDYDTAYLQWNSNYPEYLFNVGRLFKNETDNSYTRAYDDLKALILNFNTSTLREMDRCLTSLYEKYQSNGVLPAVLQSPEKETCGEGFDTAKKRVRECGVVLAEELHNIVNSVFAADAPSHATLWRTIATMDSERDLLSPIRNTCDMQEAPAGLVQSAAQP